MVEVAFFLGGVLAGTLGTVAAIHGYRWVLRRGFFKPHVPDTVPEDWFDQFGSLE